jgi:uncharacterized membrane protein YfcA
MEYAAGTSLVVITITSLAALAVRGGAGTTPNWGPVLVLTAAAALTALAGARRADHIPTARLQGAFTILVLAVATGTAAVALPALA